MTNRTLTSRARQDCIVPLLKVTEASVKVRGAFQADEERDGRVRNLTRAVAASPSTWQATARALHMFVTLRRVDARTCALLSLYTSMLNGCHYCIDDSACAAFENNVTLEEMLSLMDPSRPVLSERMVATLRFAEAVTMSPTEIPDEIIAGLKAYVDDEELLEITAVVSMKCFWNHFASTLRIPPEGRCADTEAFQSLCELSNAVRRQRAIR